MAALIPAALLAASLLLAWWTVATGSVQDGWEVVPFILFPLIAALVASVVMTFLGLLGAAVGGAVLISRGRRLWLAVLVPLAVCPVVLLAVWPWLFGPERAERLCREEGGLRGEPWPCGFSDTVWGRRDTWPQRVSDRLLRRSASSSKSPRDRPGSEGGRREFGDARFVRYFVAPSDHQGCARFPGVPVHAQEVARWRELGLSRGACIAAETASEPLARFEIRAVRSHQLWPTYVVWHETQAVELATREPRVRWLALGPAIDEGEAFEGALSGNRCACCRPTSRRVSRAARPTSAAPDGRRPLADRRRRGGAGALPARSGGSRPPAAAPGAPSGRSRWPRSPQDVPPRCPTFRDPACSAPGCLGLFGPTRRGGSRLVGPPTSDEGGS
jgi:hypothetical protein